MIIAVDFDGVLCSNEFPAIGKPNYNMIRVIKDVIAAGHEVVLWTSRVETELENAVKWCEEHGLHFCAINDAAPSNKAKYAGVYKTTPRKIYADVYVDDHGVDYTEKKAVTLLELIGGMKNGN